jgi:integrase
MRLYRDTYKDRATGERKTARKWTVEFTLRGEPRRLVLFPDKSASDQFGRKVERLAAIYGSGEAPDAALSRWIERLPPRMQEHLRRLGLVDARRLAGARELLRADADAPLGEPGTLLDDFETSLRTRERSGKHVGLVVARLRKAFEGMGARAWTDLSPTTIDGFLSRERERGASAQTVNHYVAAIRQFCRFVVVHGWATEDPSRLMGKLNVALDRRRIRRALEADEVRVLLARTAKGPERQGLSGRERALVYRLAIETGLRAAEVASLSVRSFALDGDSPTVTVHARSSKRRREDVLPLKLDTACAMGELLRGRMPSARAFGLGKSWRPAEMVAADLAAALAAEAEERAKARAKRGEEPEEVQPKDDDGRVVDFHSLRHTFVSLLARAGVGPRVAQSLARHSTPLLTFGTYAHLGANDERRALALLPDFSAEHGESEPQNEEQEPEEPEPLRKTGTDCSASCPAGAPSSMGRAGPHEAESPPVVAEAEGFEPSRSCPLAVFKTAAIGHSATPPRGAW